MNKMTLNILFTVMTVMIISSIIMGMPVNAEDNILQAVLSDDRIHVDGVPLATRNPVILSENRNFISIHDAFTPLGYQIKWNATNQCVEITSPEVTGDQMKVAAAYTPKPCTLIYNNKIYNDIFYAYRKNNGIIMLSPIVYTKEAQVRRGLEFKYQIPDISSKTITLENETIIAIGKKEIQVVDNFYYRRMQEKRLTSKDLPCAPELIDGKVYIPIEAFLNAHQKSGFGSHALVFYDETRNAVFIDEYFEGDLF